jgi:hypothetical protein
MQQAVPDLTSRRVYQSPGGAGAHLSGLYKLFLGYSIPSKSVLWPVLPQPYNRPEASGQAHTWPTCPLTHVVHGAPAYAVIRRLFLDIWCAKDDPICHFLVIGHRLAYGLNVPQTSTKFRWLEVIKSVLWFVSNGQLVAKICSFQVLRWWSAAKLCLHLVYMLGYWLKLCVNLAKTHW